MTMEPANWPVWVSVRIERTHVVDLLEVDIREDEFVITGVHHCGSVGAGKHIGCG